MNTTDLKQLNRPTLNNPPLVEVIAGVQFDKPLNFRTLDVADIWFNFGREKFPNYREVPPLTPVLPDSVQVIEFSDLPPMPRYWFESSEKSRLIQVQRDRFIYNWRRPLENMDNRNCYPRYEEVINCFFEYYDKLKETLRGQNIETVNPSFMELSYVNLIDIPVEGIAAIDHVFKDVAWDNGEKRILPPPEAIQYLWLFHIPDLPLKLTNNIYAAKS